MTIALIIIITSAHFLFSFEMQNSEMIKMARKSQLPFLLSTQASVSKLCELAMLFILSIKVAKPAKRIIPDNLENIHLLLPYSTLDNVDNTTIKRVSRGLHSLAQAQSIVVHKS